MQKLVFILTLTIASTLSFAQRAVYMAPDGSCAHFKNAMAPAAVPNKDHTALSDTFDIEHTHLEYDFTDLPSNNIVAKASLNVRKLHATGVFRFELDGYTIDSAHVNQSSVNVGTSGDFRTLTNLPSTWTVNGLALVEIWYSGSGPADPSGWGGWHHNSPYFFNLGVGFGVNPHSYGRSLFPAFDNFVEHSTYSFDIKTRLPRKAYANGIRTSMTTLGGDTVLQQWNCTDPLPAYLVSVAISNYAELRDTLNINNGTVPSLLLARPQDTNNVKASFARLQGILGAFEMHFGDYIWDKVGYAMTTQGAMEHSTSIHLPVSLANGTSMGEDIIAHELAHHWWGNLITCAKAEDMWINEGMAEFSSHLYEESVYDRDRYMRSVRGNQLQVLNYAHAQDGGYIALNGVDHGTTYGMHVYNKGAWIGHNLRGYLGDSLYNYTVSSIFTNHAHENVTTAQFEQWLTTESGVSLANFFSDWVTVAGQVAVSIDSVSIKPVGQGYEAIIGVSQNRKARSTYLADARLNFTFHKGSQTHSVAIQVQQPSEVFAIANIPFNPDYVTVNEGEDYLAGTTYDYVSGNGFNIYNLDAAKARLTVNNSTDSHYVYVAHHWAGPEQRSPMVNTSRGRFWSIRGQWSGDFDAEMRIFYDGRPSSGALDDDLVGVTEDSLVVMWRPDARYDWQLYPHFTKNTMGSSTNAFGYVTLTEIIPGDYVFANAPEDIGLEDNAPKSGDLRVYPNPSSGEIIVEQYALGYEETPLEIVDLAGNTVYRGEWKQQTGWNQMRVDIRNSANGAYIVRTKKGEQRVLLTQ